MIRENSGYRDLIVLLSGFLLTLSFAPYNHWYLALLSLTLLFICWQGITPKRAAIRGFLFGLGLFGFGISWVYISIHDFGQASALRAAMLTLLFSSLWAFFPALTGFLSVKYFRAKTRFSQVVNFPIIWILVEYIRGTWIFNGFPWFQLAYSQLDSPIAGYIPMVGAYGSGWLIALTASIFMHLIVRNRKVQFLAIASVLIIWFSGWVLSHVSWTQAIGKPFKITMIQGNVTQDRKWQPEYRREILQLYKEMTALHWNSRVIIWPESAVPAFYHEVSEDYLMPLEVDAIKHGADMVISLPYKNSRGEKYNAVMTFGEHRGVYKKIHLLPFGEYLPLQPLFGYILDSLSIMPVGHFTAGRSDQPLLKAANYPFTASICYEDAFGDEGRRGLPEAAYLVNVTNDGWFGETIEPHQHMQVARMRALETGRYLVRSTNNGLTGIVAPDGKIIQQAPLFEVTTLTGEISPMAGMTFYARFGDRPVIFLLFMLLILSLINESRFSKGSTRNKSV